MRAAALTVYAPKYGTLRLVVTRNRHGNYEYLVSNALQADLTTLVRRKRSRWNVETVFRDTKQFAGLGACQCWVDQAMVRHVGLVLLAFVVLQRLRVTPEESIAAVKERWQLAALQNGQVAPARLRACPRHRQYRFGAGNKTSGRGLTPTEMGEVPALLFQERAQRVLWAAGHSDLLCHQLT